MTVARLLGRIVLIGLTIAIPLWIGAIVLLSGTTALEMTPAAQAPSGEPAPDDPVSMGTGERGEEDASGVAEIDDDDDDDKAASEVVSASGAPSVHPPPPSLSPARLLVSAAPPHVHLEIQTPPPRA